MLHASSDRVTRQKYKNTRVLPHTSVNLEMSCTVAYNWHASYVAIYVAMYVKTDVNIICIIYTHIRNYSYSLYL